MSAYVQDFAHINYLVRYALLNRTPHHDGPLTYYYNGEHRQVSGRADEVGQILWDENYRSVNHRYNESDQAPRFVARNWPHIRFDPIEVLDACRGYRYQACEHPTWQESEAYAIVEALEARAIRHAIALKGCDNWSIYDTDEDRAHVARVNREIV